MENEIQELKTADGKGIKKFFKNLTEKIKKIDKEMSDCTSLSFPSDLAIKITYNISKFIVKMIFDISKFVFGFYLIIYIFYIAVPNNGNFSSNCKKILTLPLNYIQKMNYSVQENKYLEFLEKLGKADKNLEIDYNMQKFSELNFLSQMEEMRKIKDLSSEKGTLESRCSNKKEVKISETVNCKMK